MLIARVGAALAANNTVPPAPTFAAKAAPTQAGPVCLSLSLSIGLFLLAGLSRNAVADDANPIDKVIRWGGSVAVVAMAVDAFSPNWELQEARFPDNHYQLSLQMKRTYSGGAGEARVVFQRRAKELMRAGSFDGYEVLEYSEGMESSVLGSQRNAFGVIKLTRSR